MRTRKVLAMEMARRKILSSLSVAQMNKKSRKKEKKSSRKREKMRKKRKNSLCVTLAEMVTKEKSTN